MQKVQGAVLKGAFAICQVMNNLINLKNKKDISGKELKLQLSNIIKICTESLTILGMTNLEGNNIRRQYFYHQSWFDFKKVLQIKTNGTTVAVKPEVITITKNNDKGINNCNTTRETQLQ